MWSATITGIPEGTFLTATATDQFNNTSEFSISASSLYPVGLNQDLPEENIFVFPNPSKDMFNISGKFDYAEVCDNNGKIVRIIEQEDYVDIYELNMEDSSKGIYTLILHTGSECRKIKIILQ
jgi:hypothetical protein